MTRTFLPLAFLLLIGSGIQSQAVAQNTPLMQQQLRSRAEEQRVKWEQSRTRAEALARDNDMPLRSALPGGATIELQGLERGRPLYYITTNRDAAATTATKQLYPGGAAGLSLTGKGVTLGVWDAGAVRASHQEFGGRVEQADGARNLHYHSTHVAGTLVAAGVKSQARGMAYEADLKAFDWDNDLGEMTQQAANGLQVSNHSYGTISGWIFNYRSDGRWAWFGDPAHNSTEDAGFGQYDARAAEWDDLSCAAPYYLIVKSAGNDRGEGPSSQPVQHWEYNGSTWVLSGAYREIDGGSDGFDCVPTYSTAKNILTVGAVEDIPAGYSHSGDVRMTDFSAWGPTDDGRIKPEIVGNGYQLYSTLQSSNSAYATYSGTSMASPNVAGSLGLLLEHQRELHGSVQLRASTLKALVLHTADEAGPAPGPDYMNGFGLLNTARAAKVMSQAAQGNGFASIREELLENGQAIEYQVQSPGRGSLRVTICWTDPAGPIAPDKVDSGVRSLVNDLDLRVINTTTGEHLPWVLDPASPSAPATLGDNTRDSFEQVFIATPENGTYTIRVTHKKTLSAPQWVSIVVSIGNEPGLLSPPNNLSDVTVTPVLQWQTVPTALGYQLQVSKQADFTTVFVDRDQLTEPNYQVEGLERQQDYFWRVRVTDALGRSDWSETRSFHTGGKATLAGHAMYFDGADDRVTLPDGPGFSRIAQDDAVTVEAWVRIDSWGSGLFPIADKYSPGKGWRLYADRSLGMVFDGPVQVAGGPKLVEGQWYHVAFCYTRGGSASIYIDGVKKDTKPVSADIVDPGGSPLFIGHSPAQGETSAYGVIDQLRVWSIARSTDEITSSMYATMTGGESGLVAELKFDQARGLTSDAVPAAAGPAALLLGPVWVVSTMPMTQPPAPELFRPSNTAMQVENRPLLDWLPSTSALEYRVQVSEFQSFSSLAVDQRQVDVSEFQSPVLKPETRYFWRVNASNSFGTSDWSEAWSFTTAIEAPDAPVLIRPDNGASDQDVQVDLFWQIPLRGKTFQVQVTSDSLFEQGFVFDEEGILTPSSTITNLGNNTLYFWRVRARNAGGYSDWSAVWTFMTKPLPPEAPFLLTPVTDAVGVPVNPQFTWEAVESAKTYSMQLSEDSGFSTLLLDAKNIPFTRYGYSGLSEGSSYYWRAAAQNSAGSSAWSESRRFTVTRGKPGVPLQRSPADGAVEVPVLTVFTWDAADKADSYRLQISRFADFAAIDIDRAGLTGVIHTLTSSLPPQAMRYWRIAAENEAGQGPWSPAWSFTTGDQPLEAPLLLLPEDRAQMQPVALDLQWEGMPAAESYTIELATDAGFSQGLLQQSGVLSTSLFVDGLENEQTYFWHVRAVDGQRTSPWSATWQFTTIMPLPGMVTLLDPVDGGAIAINEVTFRWSRTGPSVNRYWLEYSFESGILPAARIDSTLADTSAIVTLNAPMPLCRWRVRAGNPAGWGPFTGWNSFQAVVVDVHDSPAAPVSHALLQNYPNPFNPTSVVEFVLAQPARVRLELVDIYGRVLRTIEDGNRSAGRHRTVLDAGDLPSGSYLLVLHADDAVLTRVATLLR